MNATACPISYDEFLTKIIKHYQVHRAKSTADDMKRLAELLGRLGVRTTAGLNFDLVTDFVDARRQGRRDPSGAEVCRPVAENTIVGELGRLKALCGWAVSRRYLDEVPFRPKERLVRAEPARRRSHLSVVEVSRLLAALETEIATAAERDRPSGRKLRARRNPRDTSVWRARRLYALVSTFAYTGARRNEVLYLQVGDLDLEKGILSITGRHKRTKTPGSVRKIALANELAETMEAWLPHAGPEWLFPGAQNMGPWTGGTPEYRPLGQVKKACERAGISGAFIHLFRHSFVTACEGWGVSPAGAMRMTGMTQKTTLELYAHTDEANLKSFVANVSFRPKPIASAG